VESSLSLTEQVLDSSVSFVTVCSVLLFSESKAERTSSSTSEVAFLNRLRDFPSDSDSSGKRFAPKNKRITVKIRMSSQPLRLDQNAVFK